MQLDLHQLLRITRRWWWLLLVAPLLGGIVAGYVSGKQPERFETKATLLVNAGITGGTTTIEEGRNQATTYSLWILSRPILDRAAQKLNYPGGAAALQEVVSASPITNTVFITVTASDTDPAFAAKIANTVADEFVLYVQEQTDAQNAQVRGNVDAKIKDTQQQIDTLDNSIQGLQARINTLTAAEKQQLDALTQTRFAMQNDLAQLQLTARSIDVELASAQTRLMVSSPAVTPRFPYTPRTKRTIMLGTFAGLAVAVSAIVLLEYLDNTVRSPEEVTPLVTAPVLATVAVAPDAHKGGRQLFVLGDPRSSPAEAIRLLRTNLEFAGATHPMHTIAVSSPTAGDGKSTIVANLGVVMAQAGLETIIIDADLRRSTQHRIFGVDNTRGLSILLTQQDKDWRSAATRLSIPRLTLIPSGPLPPNPSDLLSLGYFEELLAEIRKSADVVLIDTSPSLTVSDALVVATHCDGVFLVCREGHTRRDALRRAVATFTQGSLHLAGIVLNQHRSRQETYRSFEPSPMWREPKAGRYFYGQLGSEIRDPAATASRANGHVEPEAEDQIARRQ